MFVWFLIFASIWLIPESLGRRYGEACILDLEATWAESEPRTPLVCILSVGSDPSPQIWNLAKAKDLRKFLHIFVTSVFNFAMNDKILK